MLEHYIVLVDGLDVGAFPVTRSAALGAALHHVDSMRAGEIAIADARTLVLRALGSRAHGHESWTLYDPDDWIQA